MELKPDKKYFLEYSGEFCHAMDNDGSQNFKPGLYTFVGTITCDSGKRNIFADFSSALSTTYVMFGADRLDYIEEDHKSVIFKELHKLDKSDPKLKKVLKILNK